MNIIFFSDGGVEKVPFLIGFLLLVGLFLLVVILPQAYACSCEANPSIEDRVAESDIIFSGKLLEKVEKGDKKIFVFEIEKLWKNNSDRKLLENNSMTVYTASDEGLCGTDFANEISYLVYANMYKGNISTSMCSGNDRLFLKNVDLEYLASNDYPDGSYTLEEGQCFEGQKIVDGKCYPDCDPYDYGCGVSEPSTVGYSYGVELGYALLIVPPSILGIILVIIVLRRKK
jgi:hypothetical protein